MKPRFISLKWKLLLQLSTILFLVALGVSSVSYLHQEQRLTSTRQVHHFQSIKDLETQIQHSQEQLTRRLQYLSLLINANDNTITTAQLRANLSKQFSFVEVLWNITEFRADSAQQGMLFQRGGTTSHLQRLNRMAMANEVPMVDMRCTEDCQILASIPIILANGDIGSLGLATSLAEVVILSQQRSDRNIGVLLNAPADSQSSLQPWNLQVLALSNRPQVLPQLQQLSLQQPFRGAGTYTLHHQDQYLDISLIPVQSLSTEQEAFWVQVADVSNDYADIRATFLLQLSLILAALVFSGLLLAALMQAPLQRLARVASSLPSLARRDFGQIRTQLQRKQHFLKLAAADELTMLESSTLQLSDELERLDRGMRIRNLKLQRSAQQLARQRDFAASLLDNARAVIVVHDTSGRCRSLNRFGSKLLHVELQPHSTITFSELFGTLPEEQLLRLEELYNGLSQHYRHEMKYTDGQGKVRTLSWIHSVLIQTNRPNNVLSIGMDVTEQMQIQQQLRWLADHDALTKLPNRARLQLQLKEHLHRSRDQGQQLAILFCDLDNFKQINDTLGHPVGDALLIQVAERLKQRIRHNDFVARQGGDEFVLLLDDLHAPNDALEIARKLCHELTRPYYIDSKELFISASIGVAFYPDHGCDAVNLIKHADIAMYRAKSQGRNQYAVYAPDQSLGLEDRLSLNADLHYAIRRQEFVLYYQPQLAINTQQVIGVEALIRWQHPTRGMVPPDQFIPLAEDSGQIVEVGRWVTHEACAQLRRWEAEGITGINMSINLAGPQIVSDTLLPDIQQAIEQSGVCPQQLEFEITEGFIMRQPEDTVARLHSLRQLGVTLSIDDFGTGYSSLSYLKKLPVDKLKIDKSFVLDIGHNVDDEAIAKAVIALGQSLNLRVIAEGVEEPSHVEFLRANGCDELQGFYFCKPLPAAECAAYIKAQRQRICSSLSAE